MFFKFFAPVLRSVFLALGTPTMSNTNSCSLSAHNLDIVTKIVCEKAEILFIEGKSQQSFDLINIIYEIHDMMSVIYNIQ
jgi:hypothetical protein